MSAAAISDPDCDLDRFDSAMADGQASKKARIDVKRFDEIQINDFTLKDKGKGKNGHMAFPLIGGEMIRFNLTPSDWAQTPFGLDVDSKFEKPSFLGGKEPEKKGASEGLNLRLNLQPEQAAFLKQLDAVAEDAFGKLADNKWNPLVSTNPVFQKSLCKVVVVLKSEGQTKLAIVQDGKIHRGEGWDFIEPFVKSCNSFKFAEVKIGIRVKKLWNVAGKAGLGLEATQIVLRATEKPTEVDLFDDDEELLA